MNIKKTALAGLAVLVLFTAGCGGKKSENTAGNTAEAVVTPSPSPELQAEVTPTPAGVLVDMEKLEEPDEFETENYIGEKKDSSSSVLIINQTGDAIEHIFIRAAARDDGSSDEWGEELVHSFEWPDQEEAVYYYENNQLDLEGSTATSYDIRISYEDINRSELYYRNLPFPLIKELRLCIDISGDFGIPYARYITKSGNREFSTLQEVRAWYGLDVDDTDLDTDEESESASTTESDTTVTTEEPEATTAPETEETVTTTESTAVTTTAESAETVTEQSSVPTTEETYTAPASEEEYEEPDPGAAQADNYVGQSLGSLIGAMGSPSDSEYEEDNGSGRAGYHYYGNFTVSTTVDDDGTEIITGVW